MYLLDGDRFFVEPENVTKKLEDQFQNCLDQLLVKPLVKKLFKLIGHDNLSACWRK